MPYTVPVHKLIAACTYGVSAAALCVGVLAGILSERLVARPALVGLGLALVALIAAALVSIPPIGRIDRRLAGQICVVMAGALLGSGFLFGPLSLLIVAGLPICGVLAATRAGIGWSRWILVVSVFCTLILAGLQGVDVLPTAPALHHAGMRHHPMVLFLQTIAMVILSALVASLDLVTADSATTTLVDTVVPSPTRRTARTGSFSLSELKQLEAPGVEVPLDERFQQQKLESLGVLAGGVAHDFNNLLVAILGSSSLALTDTDAKHPAYASLREIESAAKQARDLVGQLLAYAGKGTAQARPLDINVLVREMASLLRTALGATADVDYELCPGTPIIIADPTQIRQVVMNLITNAADAMKEIPRRGTVRLSTELRNVGQDELAGTLLGAECKAGAYTIVRCADEGSGMDAATLARIFDPFFTTKRTGRGLGLAAVLGIVRRWGGTLAVESEKDVGTTFRLYLPFASEVDADEDLTTDNTSTSKGISSRRGKVLVVDDDPMVLKVSQRMVERAGMEVLTAASGQAALDMFPAHSSEILLVLLDMTMPGLTGVQTLTRLRAIDPQVCVVLCSGFSEEAIPAEANVTFLQKPYTLKQLTTLLDTVLNAT